MSLHLSRRSFSTGLLVAGTLPLLPAWAQTAVADFPSKPIRYVVPFAPGGLTDVMARLIGQKLSEALKVTVLVDNKPGANANLGADIVAKSMPDGHTWLAVTLAHAVNASLFTNLSYSVEKSLAPVVHLATSPLVLVVSANGPIKSLKEFLEKGRTQLFNGGSSGNGTPPHLGLELLSSETGLNLTHVPYKGGSPALNDLMGGQIDFIVSNLPESSAFIKSGKLRALAVTSAQRHPLLPEVTTFKELGLPVMEIENWTGMMMPANTPRAIVEQVSTLAVRSARSPDIAERISALGFTPTGLNSAEFAIVIQQDVARWRAIVKARQIKPD